MIVHAFPSRNDDWFLPYHLAAYGTFADLIVVVLDRSPQSEEICRRFDRVEVHHYHPAAPLPDFNAHGVMWHDGAIRQTVWDLAAAHKPDWIFLGDADEVPTPDVVDLVLDDAAEAYYVDWVNLWQNARYALGGIDAKWSFQNQRQRKRPLAVRRRDGISYRYLSGVTGHGDIEPNRPAGMSFDATRVYVSSPKMIHHKYANWERWCGDPLRQNCEQYIDMERDAEIVPIPPEWHWLNLPPEVR